MVERVFRYEATRLRFHVRVMTAMFVVSSSAWSAAWCAAAIAGIVTDSADRALPGAVVACYSSIGPFPFLATTGIAGEFSFPNLSPATYFLVASRPGYAEFVHSPIVVKGSEEIQVHVNLSPAPYTEVVQVEERLDSGISDDPREAEAFSSNVLGVLPLPTDRFQEALPLLPGVVRDPRGRLNFNGTRASQSALLVNGSTATDPVTGEFAVDLPLKAVEAVQVHTIPYSAEFGRVTGAVANVVTRGGSDQWDVELGNLFPSFRFRGGTIQGIGSATPQIRVSGPLQKGKAWISQGFAYRFVRSRVEGAVLPGEDEEILESFDSFTQLDLKLSEMHSLTATLSFFPVEIDNLGIDTLHPEKATPDFQSDGWNVAVADKYIENSNTVWETLFAVRKFDVAVNPKGEGTTKLTVNALRQNYFNEVDRDATQAEFNVSRLHFAPSRFGPHVVKMGGNFFYTTFRSADRSSPIDVLRADGSRSRRIDFAGSGEFSSWDLGVSGYIQDQWRPSPRLGVDLGLRYEFNRITTSHHVAPRVAVAYSPGDRTSTVFKGGFGVFFDQVFVHADSFENFQQRTETFYDEDGASFGAPLVFQNRTAPEGFEVPRSTAWHVEIDRALSENWIVRAAYRERRGSEETLVDRLPDSPDGPLLLLSSRGKSVSKEFDVTLRWDLPEEDALYFSFSKIRSDGDLNDFGGLYGNLRQPLLLGSQKSIKGFDVPERFLIWGAFRLPWGLVVSPGIEWRKGFPYTVFDENYAVVGTRNLGGRFPNFLSADLRLTKHISVFGKEARVGVQIFNVTDHFNPRDVVTNMASPDFLDLTNSVGFSIQPRFEIAF